MSPPDRVLSWPAHSPGARLNHLRPLHRPRLSNANRRRLHCRSHSRSHPYDHNRCAPYVGRTFSHGLRRQLSYRANLSAHRRRLFQGQPCQPSRRLVPNRRADAFQIYYLFINGGVIAAPLIAGTLGEKVDWHYGFGAAGVGMLIGLAIYLAGRKYLPPDSPVVEKNASAPKPRLTKRERTAILLLLLLLPVLTIAVIGNQQIFNAYLVWAQDHANLVFFGYQIPTTWLITLDSILSVSCLADAVVFWRLWSKKYPEPAEITKISIGSIIAVTGFLSLAAGAAIAAATSAKVPIGWLITFHLLNSIGLANVFPVSLALYARVAPAALSATIIGIYYLAFFAANNLVGWIGGLLEKMPAADFWLLHSALCGIAGIIFFFAGRVFGHLLAPGESEQA